MKKQLLISKRITAGILSAAMLSMCLLTNTEKSASDNMVAANAAESGAYVNFAEALQLSLYFYDANKCGTGITGGNLEWRGDCHAEDAVTPLIPMNEKNFGTNLSQEFIDAHKDVLDPDNNGTIDLCGGYHDAGDHVKFGLPGSYAASTLGWGFYEFRDAYEETGQDAHAKDILRWWNDYFLKVTYLDENDELVAYCYQVGEGDIDHNYWNAPELQNTSLLDYARPAYFATEEAPAVDQCAGAAASLAVNYLNFKDEDPEYANKCLVASKALYNFAREHMDFTTDTGGNLGYDGGFYTSSYCYDEMAWAAVWLYTCTNEQSYIDHIVSIDSTVQINGSQKYTGYISRIIKDTGNDWQNIWVHCWDTVWGGVFAKLAPITNTDRDWYIFRWNLEYWSGIAHENTSDTTFLATTPAGFSMLNNYGSCRYDCSAQLCALVYAKYADDMRFANWAEGQMEYIMGDNPLGRSYIVGYSDNYASHPHHRAAHGSLTLSMDDPVNHTHTLWGALVGGPDAKDFHNDETKDYIYNEVSVDYNAAFVGACAGLYYYYGKQLGHKPRANFPPKEQGVQEYNVSAKLEQENTERTQVTIKICSNTSIPPRYMDNLKARYYFNISEMIAAGQTIDDMKIEVYYDQNDASYEGPVKLSAPVKWDNYGTYYVEMDWSGYQVFGTREIQIALISSQDSNFKSNWNPTNDYSRKNVTEEFALTQNIPMYSGDTLVYGTEPAKLTSSDIPAALPEISVLSLHNSLDGEMSDIAFTVDIQNTGNAAIDLSDLTVRYWYTDDSTSSQSFFCDYSKIDDEKITGKFVTPSKTAETANKYFELGFAADAGIIGAGSDSGNIQIRIMNPDFVKFNQSNDYSYSGLVDLTLNPNITAYVDGLLVYGTEPVETSSTTMLGDVYIDGAVTIKDLSLLAKYIAGLVDLNPQQMLNADCYGDSAVTIKDLSILAKYVAQFDVQFGPK